MSNDSMSKVSVLAMEVRHCLRRARPNRGVIAMTVAAAGLQCAVPAALAQTKPELEEIVVTATRRDQTVLEIPFNISAVSGETLERANITESVEALRTMPGISIQDRGYRNAGVANSIVIRGINVDGGVNGDVPLAAPAPVATYVDNTALFGNFVLKDIERVEVLRGPQGTLYGSGSLAGNVRYIMHKPETGQFSGKASVSVGVTEGSEGFNFNPDILLNIPAGDMLAFRLNVGMIDNDGIVDYPNVYKMDSSGVPVVDGDVLTALPVYRKVEDVDDVDIKYARVSALLAPTDNFNAQLSYQWQDDEVGGRRQVTRGENLATGGHYDDYEFGAVQLEPSEREVQLAALELEFGLGFATLTSSTSYYEHTGSGISDNSGVYARNQWFGFYGSSPRPIAQAKRFYDDSAVTQELRLVSEGDHRIDWTAGLFYTDQDYDLGQDSHLLGYIPYLNAYPYGCAPGSSGWYCLAPYSTDQDFLFRRNQKYQETALYGEVTFNVTDDLHLTVGGRYFDNEVDVHAIVDVPIYSVYAPPGVANKKINDDGFLFKANVAWDVTDNSMLYAVYSQGYRHAGANAVPTTGKYAENPAVFTFDSDSVDNYEIGFKGSTARFTYAVDVYYADWQDPQLNTATANWGFFAAVNGESARTQGIEVELSGRITDDLGYSVGYTYTDAELTADVYQAAGYYYAGPVYDDRIAADGGRLPGTAEHVFNVSLSHDLSLSNGSEVHTVLSGYYQSDVVNSIGDGKCLTVYSIAGVCRDSPNPAAALPRVYAPTSIYSRYYAEIDGFQIWNLSSTLSKDAWGVTLFVKNLFNDDGTTGAFPFAAGGSNTLPSQNYLGNNSRDYIALPRTIGLAVSYDF